MELTLVVLVCAVFFLMNTVPNVLLVESCKVFWNHFQPQQCIIILSFSYSNCIGAL